MIFRAHGKCILAGEHTVLRGGQAVVCPLPELGLKLSTGFEKPGIWVTSQAWKNSPGGSLYRFPDEELILEFLRERGCVPAQGLLLEFEGLLIGCGLGGSAAISAVLAQAFHEALNMDLFSLAWAFEDLFHGKSSGVDVAGALSLGPLIYQASSLERQPLKLAWKPQLFLVRTQDNGMAFTRDATERVASLFHTNPSRALTLDAQMKHATALVIQGLQEPSGQKKVQEGFKQAHDCFEQWGLIPEAMKLTIQSLYKEGALAVKPTGSGGGGMVLSLWENPPPPASLCLMPVSL